MVVAPLRGIFMLGRTAFILAAAAAVPVLMKKNRKLADQVGNFMVKTGEGLKKNYGGAEPKKEEAAKKTEPRAKAAAATATASKPKPKAAPKPAAKASSRKRPSPRPKKPSS